MFARILGGLETVRQSVEDIKGSLEILKENQHQVLEDVSRTAQEVRDEVDRAERGATATLSALSGRTSEVREGVERDLSEIRRQADEVKNQTATVFDDLIDKLSEARNQWDEEIKLGLELLQAGALDIKEFIRRYGDFEVDLGDGFKRIKDLLASVDFSGFRQQFQDLIADLRSGSLDIEDIIRRVGDLGGEFSQEIANMIQKFKDGQISFQRLADILQDIAAQSEGSDLDNVIDAILDDLDQTRRD